MGNSLINDIKAPELSQSGYGAGIKKVFEQIDANFKILGNQDFVKGDQGWSIGYNELHILYEAKDENNVEKTYFTKEGIDVLNAIIGEITDQRYVYDADDEEHQNIETVKAWLETIDALKSVNDISLIDSIVPGDLFNEIYVYDPINPSNQYTIGATNDYVFKDRRFVIDVDSYDETYSLLYDCSCMVHLQVYEEDDPDTGVKTPAKKFVVLHNTPTLYFDTAVQAFCWRIGGQNTGLIAQGPKGDSGRNATFYIVGLGDPKSPIPDAPATSYTSTVTRYMGTDGGWVDLADHPAPADFADANCIAFEPTEIEDDETPTSYFGKIMTGDNGSFVVSCTNENRIQTNLNLNWLAATFASIRTTKALKGLFVPIESPGIGSSYDTAPVHAIWPAPMRNYASIFSELHISPMATYAKVGSRGDTGIDTAAKTLEGIDGTDNSRLGTYNKCVYKSTDSDNPVSLVFDYNNIIFAGHYADNNNANGVRIGIGTNIIFGDFDETASLVRFSENSKVYMPGSSYLGLGEIHTDRIYARSSNIGLHCGKLNISGKTAGTDSIVAIKGTLTVTGNTSLGATTINGVATVNGKATIDGTATITGSLKVDNTATAKVNGVPDVYLGCPIGTVVMWAGRMENGVPQGDLPEGWLFCNGNPIQLSNAQPFIPEGLTQWIGGRSFNSTTVKELQALVNVIGYRWDGDTSQHIIRLPNLQQRFPIGYDNISRYEQIKKVYDLYFPGYDISTIVDSSGDFKYSINPAVRLVQTRLASRLASFYRFSITIPTDLTNETAYNSFLTDIKNVTMFGLGSTGGELMHKLTVNEIPEHNHRILHGSPVSSDLEGYGVATYSENSKYENRNNQNNIYVDNTGGSEPHNNMPPFLAINFIIKYK